LSTSLSAPDLVSNILLLFVAGGVAWYGWDLLSSVKSERSADYLSIPATKQKVSLEETQQDLIDRGTGPMAEEELASKIANSRIGVFVAGALSQTVYLILRDYLPHGRRLEVLVNPALGGQMYLYYITTNLSAIVRETDEIKATPITVFYIDGESTLLLRKANNAVFVSRTREVAQTLAAPNLTLWQKARPYHGGTT
jgi:hypothetical protein